MGEVNRFSFEPMYYQISEKIRELIDSTQLSPHSKIWSEKELMGRFRVGRNTARQAIDHLTKQGLVYTMQGKGTFVAPKKMRQGLIRLTSFSEDMLERGLKPGAKILELAVVDPPPKVAGGLGLRSDQQAIKIERLRFADSEPMALSLSYVPYHLCPQLLEEDLANSSLYRIIEDKYGLHLWRAEQVLKPTIASEHEAGLLQVAVGTPILLVEGITFLDNDVPIEYMKLVYRGDRYEFIISPTRFP
ncbi:MAG: GntR family transcriptional regulator [Chloroflexi bacterium]|nr:GntR family transcriptional regulator [Chloroflexota bacterium]